jgi:hypothetical protein
MCAGRCQGSADSRESPPESEVSERKIGYLNDVSPCGSPRELTRTVLKTIAVKSALLYNIYRNRCGAQTPIA